MFVELMHKRLLRLIGSWVSKTLEEILGLGVKQHLKFLDCHVSPAQDGVTL